MATKTGIARRKKKTKRMWALIWCVGDDPPDDKWESVRELFRTKAAARRIGSMLVRPFIVVPVEVPHGKR